MSEYCSMKTFFIADVEIVGQINNAFNLMGYWLKPFVVDILIVK